MIEVKTNSAERRTLDGFELTERERAEFDYLDEQEFAEPRFVRYKGIVYDLYDFPMAPKQTGFQRWAIAIADTFFSGIVARFPYMDSQTVVIGTYYAKGDQ